MNITTLLLTVFNTLFANANTMFANYLPHPNLHLLPIQTIVTMLATMAYTTNNQLTTTPPPTTGNNNLLITNLSNNPTITKINNQHIEQILRNLIMNTLKHNNNKPIKMHINTNNHTITISIRDHNIGLQPKKTTLIFNQF